MLFIAEPSLLHSVDYVAHFYHYTTIQYNYRLHRVDAILNYIDDIFPRVYESKKDLLQ